MEAVATGIPEPRRRQTGPAAGDGRADAAAVVAAPPQVAPHGATTDPTAAFIRARLAENATVVRSMLDGSVPEVISAAAHRIVDAVRHGGKVIFFGNGGSSMDAGHLAAELLGRFNLDRQALPAVSLADATAALTAIANDYGYDDVFARQLSALGRAGDVAVGLSTSGDSENVVRALACARELGLYTVAMTGATGGRVADVADTCIRVPSTDTPRVQEACLLLGHTLCDIVEQELFGSA